MEIKSTGELGLGELPVSWAVLKPTDGALNPTAKQRARKRNGAHAGRAADGVDRVATKRVRQAGCAPGANARLAHASKDAAGTTASLRTKASAMLKEVLGGCLRSNEVAESIVAAFSCVKQEDMRRRLIDLCAALRRNAELRDSVMASTPEELAKLVDQDPREWATHELQTQRSQWAQEGYLQAGQRAGPIGTCPACGGRAVVATGTAGSGRSGRLTKAFAHYSCLEDNCGKSSHVKQE